MKSNRMDDDWEDSKVKVLEKGNLERRRENGTLNGFPAIRKAVNGSDHDKSLKKLKLEPLKSARQNNCNGAGIPIKSLDSRSLLQQRQSLPAYAVRDRLKLEFFRHDTLLILGDTGSGKTTQIPQFLLEAGYGNQGMIAVTQPRRVAAISVAKRVAQEVGCELGKTVGFTVRFEDCTSKSTKVRFITDGSLLREAIADRLLKNYSVVVLDEAHERTVNTDVLFGIVKESQKQRKARGLLPLKVIVTSATMDVDPFSKYFGVKGLFLEGRSYPVRVFHVKEPQRDYLEACLTTLFQIHKEAPPNHDVLVFLTGQEEIEAMAHTARLIARTNNLDAPTLRVHTLYSQLPQNKQIECFRPSAPNSRKVILATNIAETSITIPGIRYVIDSGFVKRRIHDPLTGMDALKIVRISQAQSWQRKGRAGRETEGACYRTYTVSEYEKFEMMPKPEILTSNITTVILQLLAIKIDCRTFDFMDKPPEDAVENGYRELHLLGAIKSVSNPELTPAGRKMSMFPLDPRFSKLLLAAPEFDCLEEMLSIVAMLSGENVFITTTDKREQAALAHAKFESRYGDHLTLLNVFSAFQQTENIKMWCNDNFLNWRNLLYAKDVRNQLKEICVKCELKITSCAADFDKVRKCLLVGLFNNIAALQRDNFYLTISSRHKAKIHPSSVLSGKKPICIVFIDIVTTQRNNLVCVSSIEPEWIREIVPNYPHINRIQNLLSS